MCKSVKLASILLHRTTPPLPLCGGIVSHQYFGGFFYFMEQRPTFKKNLERLRKFCAYRERCHSEVETKLRELEIYGEDAEEIILALMEERFLSEERYVKTFINDYVKLKSWGRKKLEQRLFEKRISKPMIQFALEQIDEERYAENLHSLLEKRLRAIKPKNQWDKKQKIYSHLLMKGYTIPEIEDALNSLEQE